MSCRKIWYVCAFDRRVQRKRNRAWAMAVLAILGLYMGLFPYIQDMAAIKMDAMPKPLLQLFGMEDFLDFQHYLSYFTIIYGILLVAQVLHAVIMGAQGLLREEAQKSIEYLYSLELGRLEIYLGKWLSAALSLLSQMLLGGLTVYGMARLHQVEGFVCVDFFRILGSSLFVLLFFLSLAQGLAGLSARLSASFASFLVLLSYLLAFVLRLLNEEAAMLRLLTPFASLAPETVLRASDPLLWPLGLYAGLGLFVFVLGALGYQRRDFAL